MTAKKQLEFTSLLERTPLRIEATQGRSRQLVVSFTSVGTQREQWPPREFVGIASDQGKNHVICVSDLSRCWMNRRGMLNRVAETISDYVLANGITKISAIGTSMGGYNALLLGRKMSLQRVLAFTPQYSVHPDILPEEKRWWWFRKDIDVWPFKEMDVLPKPPTRVTIFHGDTADERMHWERFPKADHVKHFIFQSGDHNFIRAIKREKRLKKVCHAALFGEPAEITKIAQRLNAVRRDSYVSLDETGANLVTNRKREKPTNLT